MNDNKKNEVYVSRILCSLAFSLNTSFLIKKSIKLAELFKADLYFIHVGQQTPQNSELLKSAFKDGGYNMQDYQIVWREGDPVSEILKFCDEQLIDLIIAGAINKENVLKFYLGSVARDIGRKANCSVLMLTKPNGHTSECFSNIVVEANDDQNTYNVRFANKLALMCNSKSLTLVKEVHNPAVALSMADSSSEIEANQIKETLISEDLQVVENLCNECEANKSKIKVVSVEGKPGYALSKYARESNADLLVVNAPKRSLGIIDRLFTHDIEYILADLPCNLLIVKKRE
jgi:nucleotide-binding universal stress UspA family protein